MAGVPDLASLAAGMALVFMQHTSASLTINENASPDVRRDFAAWFDRAVPDGADYFAHTLEGPDDMPAHIKSSLTGASLVGSFSTDGKEGRAGDKYQISSAKKLEGDTWQVVYKAKIGEQVVDLPIAIKVLWAGDTPVMTLDDFTIPGVGTFSARVLFHGDRYVGTWQHGDVGGAMWGRVEKTANIKSDTEKK